MTPSTSRVHKPHTNGTQHKPAVTIPLHDHPQCRVLPLDAITLDEPLQRCMQPGRHLEFALLLDEQ